MRVEQKLNPTFIGIGCQKCATTWIAECLKSHPEIYLSSPKEIHFFSSHKNWSKGIDWYLKYFEGSEGYLAVGEFTPSYIRHREAATRIKGLLGTVKLLISIRDPMDRFFSHYNHEIRQGMFSSVDTLKFDVLNQQIFERAIQIKPGLLRNGNYYQDISHYFDVFGRDNIHITLKEDIDKNPIKEIQKIYRFLGVDPEYLSPLINRVSNGGNIPRVDSLEIFKNQIYRIVKSSNYPMVIDFVKTMGVSDLYRKLNFKGQRSRLRVEQSVREQLLKYYKEDVLNLSTLLERDLSKDWKLLARG